MYFAALCHLGYVAAVFSFMLVSDTLASRLWVKNGCLKVNGVSRCSQSTDTFEIPSRWLELQHRATFEAGFPPYKTPKATYPVCVQELTWPLLWADVHFDLKTLCLSDDQGKRRYGTHTLCCTKPYAGTALTSPYYLNGKGRDNPEGIVRDRDNHWLKTDDDEEPEEKPLLKHDFKQGEHSFTTFRSLDSSLSNKFESEEQSLGGISSLGDSSQTDRPGNSGQPQLDTFRLGYLATRRIIR